MFTCTRRLSFDSAHRVLHHKGKCQHLHGHRYDADITCYQPKELDALGMVVDFSVIKDKVGLWIDSNLDHNTILNAHDPLLSLYFNTKEGKHGESKRPFVMIGNPTAENLAKLIYTQAANILKPYSVIVQSVRVYETPNCWADYPGPPEIDE